MPEYKRITIEDKKELGETLFREPNRGCEYTFGNLFIWRDIYDTKIAKVGGFYLIRFDEEAHAFLFPVGEGDLKAAVDEMLRYCQVGKKTFKIIAASKNDCDSLQALYPNKFNFQLTRDFAEYVYNSEDLISLAGKKYHAKRNHISHFYNQYPNGEFVEITSENIERVRTMNNLWYKENYDGNRTLGQDEATAKNAFDYFFELGFKGGFLTVDGEVVAFSMGEAINNDVFCVHEEKAEYTFDGAYTVINREFAERFCKDYKYINREDDVGDEGLRKAKLSYYPSEITEKYVVTLND